MLGPFDNLQDELYLLNSKQTQGAKLLANIRWELEGEKRSKTFFSKYLTDKIYKIKQHLNSILTEINQKVVVILKTS